MTTTKASIKVIRRSDRTENGYGVIHEIVLETMTDGTERYYECETDHVRGGYRARRTKTYHGEDAYAEARAAGRLSWGPWEALTK